MKMLPIKTLMMPAKTIIGSGAAEKTGEEAAKLGLKKCLIVTDKVMVKLSLLEGIKRSLEQYQLQWTIFDGVATEPTVEIVAEGIKAFGDNSCDSIIAVGGGSPIDTAKAIAVMVTNGGSIENYKGVGKIQKAGVPLVAIPTTAGTGSEVTPYTIITDTKTNVKMLINSPMVIPQIAIVDPLMSISCPRSITSTVGLDALTHAIEAYVSLKAQPITDIFCLSAIKLISGNLRQAWANSNNLEAREQMMLGAYQAGVAFANSSVALVHGMSRPIGAYFHVPHGASNAVLLKVVTQFSLIGNPARYAQIAGAMGENICGKTDLEAAQLAVDAIGRLVQDTQVPTMRELGVDKDKLEKLAPQMTEDAIASGSPANNPRQATREEMIELYRIAYGN
jgi:alcohol dehydrogenase class IV